MTFELMNDRADACNINVLLNPFAETHPSFIMNVWKLGAVRNSPRAQVVDWVCEVGLPSYQAASASSFSLDSRLGPKLDSHGSLGFLRVTDLDKSMDSLTTVTEVVSIGCNSKLDLIQTL